MLIEAQAGRTNEGVSRVRAMVTENRRLRHANPNPNPMVTENLRLRHSSVEKKDVFVLRLEGRARIRVVREGFNGLKASGGASG